ncbi:MAG: insulinase family protein [Bacilli bacterium]|nr:insulinase family protein [Bacilli bacterium]
MDYKIINCNNYNIYLVKTNKFKTINISTVFISEFKKDEITKDKFISEYLVNSNNKTKDEVSMSKKFMELYEPSISVYDFYNDMHHKIYGTTFLNEKYTEKGMNKKTIDFYFDVIFNPNIDNKEFDEKNYNIIMNKMKSWYKLDEEDSRSMAYFNSLSYIKDDIPIRIDTRGNIEDLLKIKRNDLKDYYFNKLNKSEVAVFIVGDYNDDLINIIKSNLNGKVNKNNYDLKNVFNIKKVNKVQNIIEEKEFNQSIIYLIYKIYNMTDRERYYVLPVLNNILGGSSAKLFNNVREKNSLAYYAYSGYSPSNNILYMYAGISKENYEKCVELMKKQLEEIKNGNITDRELKDSLKTLDSGILSNFDNVGVISNNLKGQIFFNLPSLDMLKKEYSTVTKEEVIELSFKMDLDIEYLLKGVKE